MLVFILYTFNLYQNYINKKELYYHVPQTNSYSVIVTFRVHWQHILHCALFDFSCKLIPHEKPNLAKTSLVRAVQATAVLQLPTLYLAIYARREIQRDWRKDTVYSIFCLKDSTSRDSVVPNRTKWFLNWINLFKTVRATKGISVLFNQSALITERMEPL